MGLEPTTFCMAKAGDRSRPFACVRRNLPFAAASARASERHRSRANAECSHCSHCDPWHVVPASAHPLPGLAAPTRLGASPATRRIPRPRTSAPQTPRRPRRDRASRPHRWRRDGREPSGSGGRTGPAARTSPARPRRARRATPWGNAKPTTAPVGCQDSVHAAGSGRFAGRTEAGTRHARAAVPALPSDG